MLLQLDSIQKCESHLYATFNIIVSQFVLPPILFSTLVHFSMLVHILYSYTSLANITAGLPSSSYHHSIKLLLFQSLQLLWNALACLIVKSPKLITDADSNIITAKYNPIVLFMMGAD